MDLADRFVAFAESGNQQRLSLKNGSPLQGWIMEITEDRLQISTGAGEHGQDHWLPLADIDPASLAYWDVIAQAWTPFTL